MKDISFCDGYIDGDSGCENESCDGSCMLSGEPCILDEGEENDDDLCM